jgi:hypothetical protein
MLTAENAFLARSYAKSEPEYSAQSKNFNFKCVLFCRGDYGRLFSTESADCCLSGRAANGQKQQFATSSSGNP